ncbi:hypothetical protein G6F37_007875 [Rhizopus arrhizus]|nr:hypothetical protein G6F38_008460 [Rhizopus arrhizus]KAG1156154.1 hypothetical protein G6F37_007875 [Rhizopus arrhizus]
MQTQRYKRLRTASTTRVPPKRKLKISTPDNTVFEGTEGTLGSRTLSVGNEIELTTWKSKCIAFLSRNVMIDFTNKNQLKLIGVTLTQLNSRFKLIVEKAEKDLQSLNKEIKKIKNHTTAKKVLEDIESYAYTDSNERGIKMIHVHILDQVVNKPLLFTPASQQKFTEMSFLIKFWGPVIELFFDPNQYFIQWEDTTSPYLSVSNLHFNLEFRVIIKDINTDKLDVATGEVAREASITFSKVNYDFLKSTLTTKAHLNAALKRMPYITPTRIKDVVVPMVQIMGLSCTLYGVNIVGKKVYTIQRICCFNYPSTERELKGDAIKKMIEGFAQMELMIKNIEAMITEYSRRPSHSMPNIKRGRKKNSNAKMIDIDEYISPMIPSSQDDELVSE